MASLPGTPPATLAPAAAPGTAGDPPAATGMRPKVVVAEKIADAGIKALEEHCDVDVAIGADRHDLAARLADAAGLVVRSATTVDAGLIAAAPQLQVIGRAGIGVDNIDVEAATTAGVLVVNAPEANTISAAEHTLALLLAQARRVAEADRSVRAGEWERSRFQGVELHDKTLGVIGLGRIGTLVAKRAAAFGMHVMAHDPYVGEERMRSIGVAHAAEVDAVLAEADFITIHLPLNPDTQGLIDAAAFDRMKDGVRIVNTSRGGVIDEQALADAVRSGKVASAALDVFAHEPLPDSPLRDLPQVVLTPHLGASTREAQDKAGTAVAKAVAAALRGELVLSAVNLDIGTGLDDTARDYLGVAESLGAILMGFSRGMPETLTVRLEGEVAANPVRPFTLSALKGALARIAENVSFVNVQHLAAAHGVRWSEEASTESPTYRSVLRVAGTVSGKVRSFSATITERKGPVLIEVNGYDIELPITPRLLVVRNEDVPGVIGRLGTYLGGQRVNIADMAVGRNTQGEAMMGLNLDDRLTEDQVAGILALQGIADARFVEVG